MTSSPGRQVFCSCTHSSHATRGTSHVPSPSLVLTNRSLPGSPSIPHSQDLPKLKECRQVFRTLGKDVVPGAQRTDSLNRPPEPNQLHLAFDWCQRGADIWPPGRTPSEQTARGGFKSQTRVIAKRGLGSSRDSGAYGLNKSRGCNVKDREYNQ